jgi:hypothetical protein
MAREDRHFARSTLRERIVDQVFVGTFYGHSGGPALPMWRFSDRSLMHMSTTAVS